MHTTSTATIVPASKRRVLSALAVIGIGAILIVILGIVNRARSMQEVGTWTEAQALPTVQIVQAKRGPEQQELTLPGTVRAFSSGSLYARASGYISAWYKDIGAKVKKGDVLADISAPDLDQQLAQARAQLVQMQAGVLQAQANADLGEANNKRTSKLVQQGWSSQLQGDTDKYNAESRQAALAVARANVVTQQAAVNRLEELTRFEKITAPFDGVVTARNVDIGDLVTAEGTSGHALFQVSDLHQMRIYVDVPQAFYDSMKPGLKASLTVTGKNQTFDASLVSTSNAVAEASRMALVQLQASNPDGALWPGAFTEVQFHIPSDADTLRIPTTALIFGKKGIQVARVDADNHVELQPVTLGRNLGTDVEVRKGVDLADRLIDNPQESINSGDLVRVANAKAPDAESAANRPAAANAKSRS